MKTKQTYNINSETLTKVFDKISLWIQKTKITISSKRNKEYIRLPFIFALAIAIIFPFIIIIGLIVSLTFGLNITFEREINSEKQQDIIKIN